MKKIIKRMLQAKTKEELLTCEVDLQIQYNHLSEELLEDGAISEKDYEGIFTFYRSSRELLVDINEKAESLHKKFPRAIAILQLAILYYSREILNLLYSGYWDNLLVMKGKKKERFVNLVEELEKARWDYSLVCGGVFVLQLSVLGITKKDQKAGIAKGGLNIVLY